MARPPPRRRCAAPVPGQCASRSVGDARNRARRPGRGTALGCPGWTDARARVLALGVRRVDPVTGFEPDAAGASWHGAQRLPPTRNRAGRSPAPHTSARTTTARPGQKSPRGSSASRQPPSQLGWPTAKHGARGGVRWPQPCSKHARPCLARPAQPPEGQGRVSRQRGGALVPCTRNSRLDGRCHTWSSHGDGGLGAMGGPRAPHGHGAAVLRLDGTHPGKVTRQRTPTPPVQRREETKEGKR
jgi:hypothetical protein